ncbi:MAG: 3-hydroxyacyl-ACP dehydratase FabZ [Oscillospiraceae bacterium]|nr:3-hydroxyacyl-ACP dehydratase FabZ [Oscillospiraceae bacterium]
MYNRDQIKEILPHREPFLLIDEIEEHTPNESVTAIKYVTGEEDFFAGHFPEYKVMPGVLILEALAQAGAFVVLGMDGNKGKIAFFAGADEVKWKRQVKPGDTLRLCVKLEKIKFGMGVADAAAYVGEEIACTAKIKFAIPKNQG